MQKGIVLPFLLLLASVGLIIGAFFLLDNRPKTPNQNLTQEASPKVDISNWKKYTISDILPIKDVRSELLYVENGKAYSQKFDGSPAQELITIPEPIVGISLTPNREHILFETKNENTSSVWIKKNDQVQKLVLSNHDTYTSPVITAMYSYPLQFGEIYTEESGSGTNILLNNFDGLTPKKIGFLAKPIITTVLCENSEVVDCQGPYIPRLFSPSFDGQLLLSKSPAGGGLGEPGYVVARDGTVAVDIHFYWYLSNAIWIDYNKILAVNSTDSRIGNIAKIITIEDGNASPETLPANFMEEFFSQKTLSPSRQYIVSYSSIAGKFTISDLQNKKVVSSVQGTNFIGWNKESTIFFYTNQNVLKVFEVKTQKSSLVGKIPYKNYYWGADDISIEKILVVD